MTSKCVCCGKPLKGIISVVIFWSFGLDERGEDLCVDCAQWSSRILYGHGLFL